MGITIIDQELTRTTFAESPELAMTASGGVTTARLTYTSSPRAAGVVRRTVLTFERVVDLRFFDVEIGLRPADREGTRFALLELTGSQTLQQFAQTGALQRTASPVVTAGELRHFRIVFDEHGTYDVIALGVDVSTAVVDVASGC